MTASRRTARENLHSNDIGLIAGHIDGWVLPSTGDDSAVGDGPDPETDDVHRVAWDLVAEFSGRIPSATVRHVVAAARRDLGRNVPRAALAEFAHRLARQRLTDLLGSAVVESDREPANERIGTSNERTAA